MEKNDQQPSATPPAQPYNPLTDQTVDEKGYANLNKSVDPQLLNQRIPEPTFTPPPVEGEEDPFKEDSSSGPKTSDGGGGGSDGPPPPKPNSAFTNPGLNDLPPKEKEQGAEHLANIIMGGYQKLHDFGNYQLTVKDTKIIKLQQEEGLDTQVFVPFDIDKWMTVGQFIKEYNNSIATFFAIDPEWRAKVEPVLIRVLAKRGIGLTDEQYLIYMFGQDVAIKGFQFATMKKQTRSILDFAVQQSKEYRHAPPPPAEQQVFHTPPAQEYQQQGPPPPPAQEYQQQGPPPPPPPAPGMAAQDSILGEVIMNQGNGQGAAASMTPPPFGNQANLQALNRHVKNKPGGPKRRNKKPTPRKKKTE